MRTVLREIVLKNSRLRLETIPERTPVRELGFDSFALLSTLADLEERFGLEFPLERIEELGDLAFGELVSLVRAELHRGGRGGSP